uniref:Enoyl reductase (ER) domain-containing protein n=1 Tax=Chlamydomonas leiostraca TaxID=1034604 RepID=A0A7S0RMK9_9CHLO|mmetsp:Transcript_25983/g.66107  ORF Transcript_25983/g.66107 Transcript_25983/m.66107 type:complete len:346 (+) Transcript_25983:61-1098(+)|eukprot:CAMPEP_0202861284 /NCGR_PEP_ID=MMETSP1391-20130828/2734_1 /ASSEMBLY_ACC=CAM_ASM_000867 /TAXON_ID=1034604 /ORGANISM="Chlamydomonas leiostraca, Strain SAG 11-49" /LENGTH=345 /DNA_ID=CAMNT_0049540651 /DNA_START=61 /DNA_END=1098 /DNA_ORIENTATION=-
MAPTTQTAVQVLKFDAANYLENLKVVTDAPVPTPGDGEVLVKLLLRPVNPADIFSIMGVYPGYQPTSLPAVAGMEGMGVVEANGPGAAKFAPGTRVTAAVWPDFRTGGKGLWQQYVAVKEEWLVAVPDDISDDAAACAVVNPVTVLGMIDMVSPVPEGRYVVLTAAGSALARMAMGLCKAQGIKTIGIVRRRETFDEIRAAGATEVVCSADEDVVKRIGEITGGQGAWAALDCMAGDTTNKMCEAVRVGGKVVLYGGMDGLEAKVHLGYTLFKNVEIKGFWLMLWLWEMDAAQRQAVMDRVWAQYRAGVFSSGAGKEYPLEKVVEAVAEAAKPARGPKVLLRSSA